jgi:cleavage stimulation factor subunit 3
MYLGIDAIADRDLGFAMARKATATNSLGKSETQQSLISSGPQGTKRMASPDYRGKREDNRGSGGSGGGDYNNQGNKRMRPSSPPPRGVDRDRETRWEGPSTSSRRRPFSPPPPASTWDRDDRPPPRAREPLPPRAQEREEEKPRQVSIPPVISWFVGDLPAASSFDGKFF